MIAQAAQTGRTMALADVHERPRRFRARARPQRVQVEGSSEDRLWVRARGEILRIVVSHGDWRSLNQLFLRLSNEKIDIELDEFHRGSGDATMLSPIIDQAQFSSPFGSAWAKRVAERRIILSCHAPSI